MIAKMQSIGSDFAYAIPCLGVTHGKVVSEIGENAEFDSSLVIAALFAMLVAQKVQLVEGPQVGRTFLICFLESFFGLKPITQKFYFTKNLVPIHQN